MSRDIKFRAWDGEKMVHWPNWAITFRGNLLEENGDDGFTYRTGTAKPPVMQYAGLKDKNGKEIYEGDIICQNHEVGAVEWHENVGAWAWQYGAEWGMIDDKNVQIIGNIYENPELITK